MVSDGEFKLLIGNSKMLNEGEIKVQPRKKRIYT